MKAKRILGDRAMRALLSGYERPKADRIRFERMMDEAMAGPGIAPAARRAARPALAWAAAAAAAVILLGGGIVMRSALFLDAPLAVYRIDASAPRAPFSMNRQGRLPASPDAELRFRSTGESVALAAGSVFSIGQDPWRLLTGRKLAEYRLDSGAVDIVHLDPARPFLLRTPLGDVRPLGTALSLKLDRVSLDLACVEGRIAFRPAGSKSEAVIEAGYRLRYAKGEALPAAVKLRDEEPLPYAPAYPDIEEVPLGTMSRRAGPVPEGPTEEPAAPEGDRDSRGKDAESPRGGPELKKAWSVDSAFSGAERMESSDGWVALLKGARLAVWDAATGKRRFTAVLEAKPDGFASGKGLYLLFGGQLACLDPLTGKERWRAKAGPVSFSDIGASEGLIAVASADGFLYVFDAASGSLLRRQAAGIGMYGAPLFVGGLIAVSALDGRILGFAEGGTGPAWAYQAFERLTGDRPAAMAGPRILDADAKGGFVALAPDGKLSWKGGYAAPLKRGPISLGRFAAFEDASGMKLIGDDGRIADLGVPATESLVSAAPSRRGPLVVTSDCVWLLDAEGRKSARLIKGGIAKAAVDGERIFVLRDSGELSSWEFADG